MDRGRSPSPSHIRQPSASPAGHAPFRTSGLGLDHSLSSDPSSSFAQVTTAGQPYSQPQYLTSSSSSSSQPPAFAHPNTALDNAFLQASSHHHQPHPIPSPHFGPQGNHIAPDPLNINTPSTGAGNNLDFSLFPDANLDPAFLANSLDPQLLDSNRPQNPSIDPSELMNQMATTQPHSPTPPHLLPAMHQRSPSPNASPNMAQGAFASPSHSRHASLDPSAAYGQPNEWGSMAAFRGHRRTPSETYSDVSSAHASPYLGNQDSFEDANPSPLLNAQDPSLFQEVMQFGQFNLNDAQSHISPGHSPHISPRLMPQQQSLPQFQPGSFGLDPSLNNQFPQAGMGGTYQQGHEPFPTINQAGPGLEFGQADTMSPPEINIDFAPPSRQASFEPPKPDLRTDALSPPDRCKKSNPCPSLATNGQQHEAATGYAPNPILLAALALAHLPPASTHWKPIDPSPPAPLRDPVHRRPDPQNHLVAHLLLVYPTATTFSILPTPRDQLQVRWTVPVRNGPRSIPLRSNAPFAPSALLVPTISDHTCVRIPMSVHLSAAFVARHLPVSTTASDMRGCTRERRNLSVVVI